MQPDRDKAQRIIARLVEEQRRNGAVLAAMVALIVLAVAWQATDAVFANSYAAFLLLGAVGIGFAVRLGGRGITLPFRIVAIISYAALVVLAFAALGVRVRGTVPLLIPIVLFIGGLVLAGYLGCRALTQTQQRAYWQVFVAGKTRPAGHSPWSIVPMTAVSLVLAVPLALALIRGIGLALGLDESMRAEAAARAIMEAPDFAENSRALGRPLGYGRNEVFCYRLAEQRFDSCSDIVCEEQNPYVLEGCLETAGLVMPDEEDR